MARVRSRRVLQFLEGLTRVHREPLQVRQRVPTADEPEAEHARVALDGDVQRVADRRDHEAGERISDASQMQPSSSPFKTALTRSLTPNLEKIVDACERKKVSR